MYKVKKIDAPLLIIGLGGTGFDALMRIKHDFSERFESGQHAEGSSSDRPPRTEYLVIDSDPYIKSLKKYGMTLSDDEFIRIGCSFNDFMCAIHTRPYINEWTDNDVLNGETYYFYCSRQGQRVFLFDKIDIIASRLQEKLRALNNYSAGTLVRTQVIQVKVIASVSGNAGSGTLLDVAYVLKHIAEREYCKINVEAHLMMPDVTVEHAAVGDPVRTGILHTNSYALLKELDYWMNADDTGIHLTQQYSDNLTIQWRGIPFENVYLMCSRNDQGRVIKDSYEHNINALSEYFVHCYESTECDGGESCNPDEVPAKFIDKDYGKLVFWDEKASMAARARYRERPYPVSYRYHALGAYSSIGYARYEELFQMNMVYNAVAYCLKRRPVLKGSYEVECFINALLTLDKDASTPAGTVWKRYRKRHPVPDLSEINLDALKLIDEKNAPHGSMYDDYSTGLNNCLQEEEKRLTDEVWNMFLKEARAVGEDIERGPRFLLSLLNNAVDGLAFRLNVYIDKLDDNVRNIDSMMSERQKRCAASFRTFERCSFIVAIFKKMDYYKQYMSEAGMLYDVTRAACYNRALFTALTNFRQKLAKYIAVLSDHVREFDMNCEEYCCTLEEYDNSLIMFKTGKMFQRWGNVFSQQLVRDNVAKTVFGKFVDYTENELQDAASEHNLDDEIRRVRAAFQKQIGHTSLLDKITDSISDPNMSVQDYVTNILCPMLYQAAEVMMYTTIEAAGLYPDKAVCSAIVSVPAYAEEVVKGIEAYCNRHNLHVIIKRVRNSDNICWITDKGGMPMYFYGHLDILKYDYMENRERIKGYHLYMGNNAATAQDGPV